MASEPRTLLSFRLIRRISPARFLWAMGLGGGALILATAGFGGVWAFDGLRFVPLWLRSIMVGLFLLAALPAAWTLLDRIAALPAPPPWLIVVVAGGLFWIFRERTFWGDGLYKTLLLATESLQSDPYVWKEPLDALLAHTLVDLLAPQGWRVADAVALLSVLAGMVYIAAALLIARLLVHAPRQRLLLWIGLIALGSSQLWFGHVENYSLVTAFTYLTVALALAALQGRAPLWSVGLVAGAAVSFHPQAVFSLPALLILVDRKSWPRRLGILFASGAIVPLLTTMTLIRLGAPLPLGGDGYAGDPQLFWTLPQALAPAQWWDAILNLWLLVPALPLLLWWGVRAWTGPVARADRAFRYLTVLATGLLLYHFTFQNDLPRPQDWDLFAITGPAVALWGMVAAFSPAHAQPTPSIGTRATHHAPRALLPALIFSILISAAWIGVNHHFTLLQPDPSRRTLYEPYRLLDLGERLDSAVVTPVDPICDGADGDPTGCRRVALTQFMMPQSGDMRATIFAHAPAHIVFPLQLPPEPTFLWTSIALDPLAWGWGGDGVTFRVLVDSGDGAALLFERHLSPQTEDDLDWHEIFVPLDVYRGHAVNLILETAPGPAADTTGDRAGWGLPWLMGGTLRERIAP